MSRIFTRKYSRSLVVLGISLFLSACDSETETSIDESFVIAAATGADFVALRVEAENFTDTTRGWTLTNHENIPTTKPDPDAPHHQDASGGANMELLPDTRVTHNDELIAGVNYWGNPGNGPRLEYEVNLPEAGRYQVWVRAFSTGLEDNGIHVGFNNEKPASGARIQLCSGKNKWTWSSAQRVQTNHCGVPKTIYLDFPTAGKHSVVFYAREDGYELDQFMLLKETSNGARNCFPVGEDRVKCVDVSSGKSVGTLEIPVHNSSGGNVVNPPPPPPVIDVDLDLDLTSNSDNFTIGDVVNYTMKVKNKSNNETATGVTVKVNLPAQLAFSNSNSCTESGATIRCTLQEIGPNKSQTVAFDANVTQTGTARVDAQVAADQADGKQENNSESISVEANPYIPLVDGELAVTYAPNAMGVTDTAQTVLVVNNSGRQVISSAELQIESNPIITLAADTGDCSGQVCTLADIPPGGSILVPVTITPASAGLATVQINLTVASDEDQDNNSLSVSQLVKDAPVVAALNNDVNIEAEDFYSQNTLTERNNPPSREGIPGWSVTESQIQSKVQPDFDLGNFANASRASYIEYLPDVRVGSEDPAIDNTSNFSAGGTSAILTYRAFFNTAGRYFVNARLRANNAEDATVHVGVDNGWPETASSVTSCNPDGTWRWTNSQLIDGLCDSSAQAFIDIETAGNHAIHISSGTDGVEVDKLVLRLNNQDMPVGLAEDQTPLPNTDLDIAIASAINGDLDESTDDSTQDIYQVRVENLDNNNTAYDITVSINGLDSELMSAIAGFQDCRASSTGIDCKVYALAPNSSTVASVALDNSASDITAVASLGQASDTDPSNNSTVASAGGGAFSLWFMLFALIPVTLTIRSKKASKGSTLAAYTRHSNS